MTTKTLEELGLPEPPKDIMKAMYDSEVKLRVEIERKLRETQERARNLEIQLERSRKSIPERLFELEQRMDQLTRQVANNSRLAGRNALIR